jgi:Winged helix DNA-binding domain
VEGVLTTRRLNRAMLARQLLLERADLSVARALEHVGGLQTQESRAGYIGLWSRLAAFERESLTRALERRSTVQATLMRSTIHTVSAKDFPIVTAGLREARRQAWMRGHAKRVDVKRMPSAARRVAKLLEEGPRQRADIVAELGLDSPTWNGVGMWIDLVRVPPSGTWERPRADLYALAEQWLGPSHATEDEGLALLLRRYLRAFGPAPLKDGANWAGLPSKAFVPVAEGMRLRRFTAEDGRTELLDLPRAPLPDSETPAPVRFLPAWDALTLAHARRGEILPEEHRTKVFNTRTPHSLQTFLVDGRVAGSWKVDKGRVHVQPFRRLAKAERKEVDAEAERLQAFLA